MCEKTAAKYLATLFLSRILQTFHAILQEVYSQPNSVYAQ